MILISLLAHLTSLIDGSLTMQLNKIQSTTYGYSFLFFNFLISQNNNFFARKHILQWKNIFIQCFFFFSQSTKILFKNKLLFDHGTLGKECKSRCYFVHFYVEFVELFGHEGWEMCKRMQNMIQMFMLL
jgi:hypothetical protein